MPSTAVGDGSGSHLAAAVISARCAVCQDTRYLGGDLGHRPVGCCDRLRQPGGGAVSRDLSGICAVVWVNHPRAQVGSA
jgi:hypothetical protein